MIKNTKPKYINDNAITSNMVAILISAYSNMINKHHRILLDTWYIVLYLVGMKYWKHWQ